MELMKLAIKTGFAVTYNKFYDVSPIIKDGKDLIENWGYFTEDLMQIVKMDIKDGQFYIPEDYFLIDLGWYPDGEPSGGYRLDFVKIVNGEWEEIREYRSKDRYEIADKIEEWME